MMDLRNPQIYARHSGSTNASPSFNAGLSAYWVRTKRGTLDEVQYWADRNKLQVEGCLPFTSLSKLTENQLSIGGTRDN